MDILKFFLVLPTNKIFSAQAHQMHQTEGDRVPPADTPVRPVCGGGAHFRGRRLLYRVWMNISLCMDFLLSVTKPGFLEYKLSLQKMQDAYICYQRIHIFSLFLITHLQRNT